MNKRSRLAVGGAIGLASLLGLHVPTSAQPVDDGGDELLGGRAALDRLAGRLPIVAARNALTANELRRNLLTDRTLRIDGDEQLLYVDPVATEPASAAVDAAATAIEPSEAFTLHGRPGSSRVIYLDFDGQTLSGTSWNNSTGGACYSDAYDFEAGPATFSDNERRTIIAIWQRVVEDYAPFDIDVTTQDPGADAITRAGSGDTRYGTRALITRSTTLCPNGKTLYASVCSGGCGGVAYVGTYDRTSNHAFYQPALVFLNGVGSGQKNVTEATSHEVGHNLGLSHDGSPTASYYRGHGSWAPIMGVGYDRAITQWSRGEYVGANQTQDDFTVMQTNGAIPIADDHPGITVLTAGTPAAGVVSTRTDEDVFAFSLAQSSTITLTATPAAVSPNLDIRLTLSGPSGTIVADPPSGSTSKDAATGLGASISTIVTAGAYTVRVDGVGFGDPLTTGYSDYGSVGAFMLTLATTPVGPPTTTSSTTTTLPPTTTTSTTTTTTSTTTSSTTTTAPPPATTLTVRAYWVNQRKRSDLTWNDPTGNYQIIRNGQIVDDFDSDGTYTDHVPRSTTSATYRVCLVSQPTTCSNDVTVTW